VKFHKTFARQVGPYQKDAGRFVKCLLWCVNLWKYKSFGVE